eukprot:5820833-Pleurochrysis_carterae.AAC.2
MRALGEGRPAFNRALKEAMNLLHSFVPSVVVNDHESKLARTVDGLNERTGNINMDQSPGISWRVAVVGMRQPGSVCFEASRTRRRKGLRKTRRCVRHERRESLDASSASVWATVHAASGVVGRHDMNVGRGTSRVHG